MPSPFDAVSIEALRRRRTAKWSAYGGDVLAAWIAEMDFDVASPIQRALRAAIARADFGYPPPDGLTGLPEASAAFFAAAYGWQVDARRVGLVTDVLHGLAACLGAFSPPGSAVVVPTPAYPPFFEILRLSGRAAIEVPMVEDDARLTIDLGAIGRALAAGARTVLLCHPHNPTGRSFTRDELFGLADTVARAGGRVVADEVHAPLSYRGRTHVPYASVSPAAAEHSVTVTSASKGWNLPGLKCAQVVLTNEPDAERWRRLSVFEKRGASPLGIAANHAAYTAGRAWLARAVGYLDGNRALLAELLATHLPEVGYRVPDATYLAWLDCRGLRLGNPAAFFLDRARVALSDGAAFGAVGAGFVRLNFATSRQLLERIVRAMGAAAAAR